jgi:hypothetical protein
MSLLWSRSVTQPFQVVWSFGIQVWLWLRRLWVHVLPEPLPVQEQAPLPVPPMATSLHLQSEPVHSVTFELLPRSRLS